MVINELINELKGNNINEEICLVFPSVPVEGALCMVKTEDNGFRVFLNERGNYLFNESFESEDVACRFFLKKALLEPTFYKDFVASDLLSWRNKKDQIISKYKF